MCSRITATAERSSCALATDARASSLPNCKPRRAILLAVGLWITLGLTTPGSADPFFVIESEEDWSGALADGFIGPVLPPDWEDYQFQWGEYLREGDPYPLHEYLPPMPPSGELYLYEGGGAGGYEPSDAGLVMAWGPEPVMPGDYAAAWTLNLGEDPDLRNCTITTTVTAPPFITVISFGIRDTKGAIMAWYWNVGPGMSIPHGVPTTITINTSLTGVNATVPKADSFMRNPAFDLTKALDFIFDENSNWVGDIGIPTPGSGLIASWNYWHGIMVIPFQGVIKWAQPPTFDDTSPMIDCFWGWDEFSIYGMSQIVADDWLCEDDRPITNVHWWGSYQGWDGEGPPPAAPIQFHIGIWTDVPEVPVDPASFSHPGQLIHQWRVPRSALLERRVGCDFHTNFMPVSDACFRYDFQVPPGEEFWQQPGPTVYWISIAAVYEQAVDPINPWGWKTRRPEWNDDAVRITNPTAPEMGMVVDYIDGNPIWWPTEEESWDMAFVLTTNREAPQPSNFKWDQPPQPGMPDNVYLGWNEYSVWDYYQIVADDFQCDTPDPVTKIRWWGSFLEWAEAVPPVMPPNYHFHIHFWTDAMCTAPDGTQYSCPDQVIHEITCFNFNWKFVGWDYDPILRRYDACFEFDQDLLPEEYFYQPGDSGIYWISIAACYNHMPPPDHPWGWKTRPWMFNDDAVRIWDPVGPDLMVLPPIDRFVRGEPIYWPTQADSWDMCFELISKPLAAAPKWEQLPDVNWPGIHAHDDFTSGPYITTTAADQWQCQDTGEVWDFHWYGNYEMDALNNEIRGSGIMLFDLSIYDNNPAMPWCLPGLVPVNLGVQFAEANETATGLVNSEGSQIYRYDYTMPAPFIQNVGEYYWLALTAMSVDPMNPPRWRWQEAQRGPVPILCPGATEVGPIPQGWQSIQWPGFPTPTYSDLAFAVTSDPPVVKWSQPPEPYVPEDAFHGWDEHSVWNWQQFAADDWLCDTEFPVTDIHWWGSFQRWPQSDMPPVVPGGFHIGVWTDGMCTDLAGNQFSCPQDLIWENYCDTYGIEFVGWDFDPRDPLAPPEATFKYTQLLDRDQWFFQEPDANIYWLSIAAVYGDFAIDYPWGWKTVPRDPASPAPDDAVRVTDPTAPSLFNGVTHVNVASPIYWPTLVDSWDLAFQLTTLDCDLPCDLNGDGLIDGRDIQCFCDCLVNGFQGAPVGCNCACADVDGDGYLTMADISQFVSVILLQ